MPRRTFFGKSRSSQGKRVLVDLSAFCQNAGGAFLNLDQFFLT